MKKPMLLLLLLPLLSFALVDWVTVKMDDRASIEFPSEPKMNGEGGFWGCTSEDFSCLVYKLDFAAMGFDSTSLATDLGRETSLDEFGNSMIAEMGGSTMLSKERLTISGKPAFRFKIDFKSQDKRYDRLYCDVVFVGTNAYALYFYESSAKEKQADRTKFLNSFRVK